MSALTKLFVVLLIVCSLLLTAATVVFVNRTDNYTLALESSRKEVERYKQDLATAENAAKAAQMRESNVSQADKGVIGDLQKELADLRTALGQKDVELAATKANAQIQAGSITQLTAGLQNAQAVNKALTQRNNDLATAIEQLRVENADTNSTASDLRKRLDEAERERLYLREQLVQSQSETKRLQAFVDGKGLGLELNAARPVGNPNVRGVIRNVNRNRAGITVASISLGSADNIQKGMTLRVVDPVNQTFLGTITIDTVDTNTSVGRIEGPGVAQVKPDNVVLSRAN